jgi:hypothetical protein
MSGSFSIAFCYPISGPIVVKGHKNVVLQYINKSLPICHFNIIQYHEIRNSDGFRKKIKGEWLVNRKGWDIKYFRSRNKKIYRLVKGPILIASFKRVPKRFIKEFELYDKATIIYNLARETDGHN